MSSSFKPYFLYMSSKFRLSKSASKFCISKSDDDWVVVIGCSMLMLVVWVGMMTAGFPTGDGRRLIKQTMEKKSTKTLPTKSKNFVFGRFKICSSWFTSPLVVVVLLLIPVAVVVVV